MSTGGTGGALRGETLSPGSGSKGASASTVVVAIAPPPPPERRTPGELDDETVQRFQAEREQESFDEAHAALKQALQDSAELAELSEQIVVDMTPQGMRIQIIDQDSRAMFARGSTRMERRAGQLLAQIAEVLQKLPNDILDFGTHGCHSVFDPGRLR